MNKDQISGKFDRAKGKVKERVGEAVGNQQMANEGVADQLKGVAKETWGNAKDAATDAAEYRRHEREAENTRTRDSIVNKANEVKDHISDKLEDAKERIKSERRSA